jgi:hypothetical protein
MMGIVLEVKSSIESRANQLFYAEYMDTFLERILEASGWLSPLRRSRKALCKK